jgi:cellulose synthase/poly-beta-1,6-N-acetylglucosamine synthase-like glycosyltransferase
MKWVFWGSAAWIGYTMAGYPLWLYLRSRWRRRPVRRGDVCPSVSIVIAAHNEAAALPEKLRNLAEVDYPPELLEVVVVSDGSTDSTLEILHESSLPRLHVRALGARQGKAVALNAGVEAARGEIVVFTDARQRLAPQAIRELVRNFADPSVGCVSGELVLAEEETSGEGLGLYWRMEKKIRELESAGGSVVGATGSCYAARRDLLAPLPVGTLLDDVYLPLWIARQGGRVIFEPRARAFDRLADRRWEFRRKVRTLVGNCQLLRLAPWSMTRSNPLRFEFVSHKLMRLALPFALGGMLTGALLAPGMLYRAALVAQLAGYGLAALGFLGLRLGVLSRLSGAAQAFVLLNAAALVALIYFAAGKEDVWAAQGGPAVMTAAAALTHLPEGK